MIALAAIALLAQAAASAPGPATVPVSPGTTFHGAPVAADEGTGLAHLTAADAAGTDSAAAIKELDAALMALPRQSPLRWATQCMRAARGVTGADAAADECLAHFPGRPEVLVPRAVAAFEAGESGTGARLLATALRAHPEIGNRFLASTVDGWLRQLNYDSLPAERAALIAALAASRYGAAEPGARAGVLREAALDRLAARDVTGAQGMVDQIFDPADLLAMLVDRRYAALWPGIVASAGPGLEGARERFVAVSRAAYEAQPDAGGRRMLSGVLERTGHGDEAQALLRATLAEPDGPARDGWYRGAAAVRLSKLLARSGGLDAATILSPMVAELPGSHPEQEYVVPNLAMAQIALDRPAEAIATVDRYPFTRVESPAANAFPLAIRACALHRLGRDGAAAPMLAQVAGAYANNVQANAIAINCTGNRDARARAWIARVRDPAQRGEALMALVRARQPIDPAADPLDPGRDALREIAWRTDVAATFAELGRMPDRDEAAAVAEWRSPR